MTIKANTFIIRAAPHSLDTGWRLLYYSINALLLFCPFLIFGVMFVFRVLLAEKYYK